MAARRPKKTGKGVLLRGADGSLYHIPDKNLKAYRLPDALTGEARALLDKRGVKAKKGKVPAFHGTGLVSAAKKAIAVQGGKAIAVQGGKAIAVKGRKAIAVQGRKAIAVQGRGGIAVQGRKAIAVQGRKAIAVNLNKVKALTKGK